MAADASPAARGRPRDPELDDVIVAAATTIAGERGFDNLTMDGVARRAGVAKATLYRRFPGKVDLIVAVCHANAPAMPSVPDTGSVRGDLAKLLATVTTSMTRSSSGRLIPPMITAAMDNDDVREALREFSAVRRRVMSTVLARAVERGEIDPSVDVDLLADELVGAIFYRWLFTTRPVGRTVIERLIDQALGGAAPKYR